MKDFGFLSSRTLLDATVETEIIPDKLAFSRLEQIFLEMLQASIYGFYDINAVYLAQSDTPGVYEIYVNGRSLKKVLEDEDLHVQEEQIFQWKENVELIRFPKMPLLGKTYVDNTGTRHRCLQYTCTKDGVIDIADCFAHGTPEYPVYQLNSSLHSTLEERFGDRYSEMATEVSDDQETVKFYIPGAQSPRPYILTLDKSPEQSFRLRILDIVGYTDA